MYPSIQILPFKYVNAITDMEANRIFLSAQLDSDQLSDTMMDEYAHLISGSPFHQSEWKKACLDNYGKIPIHSSAADEWIREIPSLGEGKMANNIGNITGLQNMLLDYHLLQAYRKFAQRILGTEGSWEVTGDNKIRLKPTPKGSFPVVVRYIPAVDSFKLPSSQQICLKMLIAEAKVLVGLTRRKMAIPSPDGGTMNLDGEAMVSEGREEIAAARDEALKLSEPLGFLSK